MKLTFILFSVRANFLLLKFLLRGHNWVHCAYRLIVYCYLEFKLHNLFHLNSFAKKKNPDGFLFFLKAFSWETNLRVTLGGFTVNSKVNFVPYIVYHFSYWNAVWRFRFHGCCHLYLLYSYCKSHVIMIISMLIQSCLLAVPQRLVVLLLLSLLKI